MGVHTKPRWRAYLWTETGHIARFAGWDWVEYEQKRNAVNMARKCATALYHKYRDFPDIDKPVEEKKSDGSIVFRIPGMNEDRWPKVVPIEEG